MKKIVIAGGTGFLGTCLVEHFKNQSAQIVILTRGKSFHVGTTRYVTWDGKTLGPWKETLENADVLINLNGKSVDCRYTDKNKNLIYATRLEATAVLGKAIQAATNPPKLWINASSATIYRHSLDKNMDEYSGEVGSGFSVDVCQRWEKIFNSVETKNTRKILIRTAIVLGKKNGALKPLTVLTKLGLGGRQGPGNQYVSWIHESDFVGVIDFFINNNQTDGVYNVTSPSPVPNKNFMLALRRAVRISIGIPLPKSLLELGTVLIGTETELILKSRRVIPQRLLEDGYKFRFDRIEGALEDLINN